MAPVPLWVIPSNTRALPTYTASTGPVRWDRSRPISDIPSRPLARLGWSRPSSRCNVVLFRRICTSPVCLTTLPRLTRNCLCRRRTHRGRRTANIRDGRRSRRMECLEQTYTPSSNYLPRPRLNTADSKYRPGDPRPRHRCCSRCRPHLLTSCAEPRAGWPHGCNHRGAAWRCPIWVTPWPAVERTAQCGRP